LNNVLEYLLNSRQVIYFINGDACFYKNLELLLLSVVTTIVTTTVTIHTTGTEEGPTKKVKMCYGKEL
jgi:hypothetical protein